MPSDAVKANATPFFAADDLRRWTASVFAAAGARAEDAQATADVLVRTSLRGIDTHGVARILIYLEKVRSGEVNAQPSPTRPANAATGCCMSMATAVWASRWACRRCARRSPWRARPRL